MFRSLSVRDYRIWFIGALLSNIGAWMQTTTQSWVVLTEIPGTNASAVGVTMALQFGPQLLLVPFSGAVADRFDRRKVLMVTQSLLMLLAAGLGVLLLLGHIQLWHIYLFALSLGVVNAFDTTSRQAFVSDLVGTKQLSNAVALNSASFNTARLIGPAIAGILIAVVGSGWVFLINAASFVAVLVALACIHSTFTPMTAAERREPQLQKLLAGFKYVRSRQDLMVIFLIVFIVGAFSMNFPVIATTMTVQFGRDAADYGLLFSMLAIGSLSGALLAARRPAARMRVVIMGVGGIGVVSLVAAFMPTFWSFGAVLIFFGLGTATMLTTANGFVQSTTDPQVRGRVLALYMAILMGGTPIGAPLVGAAADALGARSTLIISAVGALTAFAIGLIWLFTARKLRFRRGANNKWAVTHVGRPGVGDDPARQQETLTAPISVLRRGVPSIGAGESVPLEGSPIGATGAIRIDDLGEDPDSAADQQRKR